MPTLCRGPCGFLSSYVRNHWKQIPWFRSMVFVVCMAMMFVQAANLMRQYREYNFAISVEEEYRTNIVFPGVTLCVDSWLDSVRTCAYTNGKCTKNDLTYTIGLYFVQSNPDLRKFGAFPSNELFNCTMSHPVCPTFDCIESMRPTYFRSPSQLCYTVDVVQFQADIVSKCSSPWMYSMELNYRVNRTRVITFMPTNVFPLVIHQPNSAFPDLLTAITLRPGTIYELAMKQKRILRLEAPFKSRCQDYVLLGYKQEYGGFLNFDLCLQNCSIHLEHEKCGCVMSSHEYAGHQRWPLCNFTYGDSCASMLRSMGAYDVCYGKCGMPCREIVYDLKVVGLGFEKGTRRETKNKFTLKLSFGSDAEEITKYVPALDYSEALAYMGAYMGTWIGISLLDSLLGLEKWYEFNRKFMRHALRTYLGSLVTPTTELPQLVEQSIKEGANEE